MKVKIGNSVLFSLYYSLKSSFTFLPNMFSCHIFQCILGLKNLEIKRSVDYFFFVLDWEYACVTQGSSLVAQNLHINIHSKHGALSCPGKECHIKVTWDNLLKP